MTLADEDTQSNIDAYVGKYAKCVEYDNVADVTESWVQWRSDFQSGSRVLTRANCSGRVREIESRSWERWLGWRGWRMIICKRPVPPYDHLQEARSSGWSFARGQILWMIICKWPVPPNDHLQEAGSSGWSFAKGRILWMIICKRPDPLDDHL